MKIDYWLTSNKDVGIFLLRLFIGLRLFYGVVDNVMDRERMVEFSEFLHGQGFPLPTLSAVVSVYAQLVCGILILAGFKIRLASFVMILNFIIAITMVHRNDTIEGMTPALAMLFGSLTFLFTGAGKFSFDKK
jgi:putative oxidoreductase